MVGIIGYGAYVPIYRIKIEDIAALWGQDPNTIKNSLGIYEKAVGNIDEDAATIAVEAGKNALARANIDAKEIGALYIGSESHPYVVKSTASIVGEALNITPNFSAADLEFACRAGTSAIIMNIGLVKSGYIKYGMAIGADTAQSKPGDVLEYSAGSGGAAFIIGNDNVIAEIEAFYSFTTDTPDFWRREGVEYPSHGERFTGEPAYFKHVINATKGLLEHYDYSLNDFDYVVFHQPNSKFPLAAAKKLGINKEKVIPSLMVRYIGNTYSGSSLIGLCAILDIAKPGDRILVTSFGSGAGSDSFAISVKDRIEEVRDKAPLLKQYLDNKVYVDYATYLKMRGNIRGI